MFVDAILMNDAYIHQILLPIEGIFQHQDLDPDQDQGQDLNQEQDRDQEMSSSEIESVPEPLGEHNHKLPSRADIDKVRSVLRQHVREWSVEVRKRPSFS